jgi:putative transposase
VAFRAFLRRLFRHDWVVYAKPPFGGPTHVLNYLARYTHRVAISNHRIANVADGHVTFQWTALSKVIRQTMSGLTRTAGRRITPDSVISLIVSDAANEPYSLTAPRLRTAILASWPLPPELVQDLCIDSGHVSNRRRAPGSPAAL